MITESKVLQRVFPRSRSQWRSWLNKNHELKLGISLVIVKKRSSLSSLTVAEAVDEALCFAWIHRIANLNILTTFGVR
ncbi:MAG TPA: hypothetical protein VD927_17630 [Chryseosolibacter sp.]|nr:hypothetical protein [Chryseosolibacter sp.]